MKILITAGPTHEYIDQVRYLANASSGMMGYALTSAAKKAGHKVVLVSGPTNLAAPQGVQVINVTSADEMHQAVKDLFIDCDILIMAAAVSDYTPLNYYDGKHKKSPKQLTLKLKPTIDILKEMGGRKGNRILIGFALETSDGRENALRKLHDKKLDYVVLNSPDAFGADESSVEIYNEKGLIKRFDKSSKKNISEFILSLLKSK